MKRLLLTLLFLCGLAVPCSAQTRYGASIYVQSATPTAITALGTLWWNTDTSTLSVYSAVSTWTPVALGSAGLPSGAIIFVASGTCPATYTEVAGLNGRMIRGTVAANGNVGTTGGSDTYTPTGTNSVPSLTMNSYTPAGTVGALTFTGAAWAAPAIAWPVGVPTFTGSSGTTAAANTGASAIGSTSSTATLKAHTHTFTPAGTVAWPAGVPTIGAYTPTGTINTPGFTGNAATLTGSVSTPTFTGTQATVIPAYLNLIACSKD